jgi:hypothetical protein
LQSQLPVIAVVLAIAKPCFLHNIIFLISMTSGSANDIWSWVTNSLPIHRRNYGEIVLYHPQIPSKALAPDFPSWDSTWQSSEVSHCQQEPG